MTNMSYCRFENTLADLKDCEDNWNGSELDDGSLDKLSESEQRARERLLEVCRRIISDYGDEEEECD